MNIFQVCTILFMPYIGIDYDRGRKILQENYYLMGRLRDISDSKHKDSGNVILNK